MTTCTTCPRALLPDEADRHGCAPCEHRAHGWLAELPHQLVVLRASLTPETTGTTGRRPATRTAPMPCREDVLSLVGPTAEGVVHDEHGDQHGPVPISGVMVGWARIVAEERGLHGPRTPHAGALAGWLGQHLAWCAEQPWWPELYAELHDMIRAVRGITRTRPGRRAIAQPCPRCDALALTETDWQTYRECADCGSLFTAEDLALGAALHVLAGNVSAP